jgi:hypothetical protein
MAQAPFDKSHCQISTPSFVKGFRQSHPFSYLLQKSSFEMVFPKHHISVLLFAFHEAELRIPRTWYALDHAARAGKLFFQ